MKSSLRSGLAAVLCLALVTGGAFAQVPLEPEPFWSTTTPDLYSTGMIWRDCNDDGYIDVFISNGNDIVLAANHIYLSHYGEMPVSPTWISTNIEYTGHCAVGDIDDNGWPDFITANFLGADRFDTPNTSVAYMNYGVLPGTSPDWRPLDSSYSFSCALGDVDGDGDLDLALATGTRYIDEYSRDLVYFNNNGSFESLPGWQSGLLTAAIDVTWGDVDNDGDLDLAFCYDSRGAGVYYNNGGILESNPSWLAGQQEPANTVIFGDVDNDGWRDLIVAFNYQLGSGGQFRVYYNDGAGGLATTPGWQSATAGYGSAVSLYDFDNDGDDDLAAGRWWDSPRIYENTGSGFTTTPVWQATPSTVVEELAWIDIDGDGVESRADTIAVSDSRKLFYAAHHPLQRLDSVVVDGVALGWSDYCYDLVDAWVSLAQTPVSDIVLYYQYSFKNDLTVTNWDTYTMAMGNTNRPLVDVYAEPALGQAPLTVQFADSSQGASNWLWKLLDGTTYDVANPQHVFSEGGAYDVYVENTLADGRHNRRYRNMVVVLADTIYFPDIVFPDDDSIVIPVYLKNTQPVEELILPVVYGGETDLSYEAFDTDGCRTDYFADVSWIGTSPAYSKIVFRLKAGVNSGNTPLEPGYGPIINLHFSRTGGMGVNVFDTATTSGRELDLDAGFVAYQPRVVMGNVQIGICGDLTGDGTVADIGDLVHMVDYFFSGGPPPVITQAANIDGEAALSISDIVYMVEYMFEGGPAPDCTVAKAP